MQEFLDFMKKEKKKADNTLLAYKRDLLSFEAYLKTRNVQSLNECSESDAIAYVMDMNGQNRSGSTINRRISALRSYYDYELKADRVRSNPFARVKASRVDRRRIDYLTIEETERLMGLPLRDRKGLRDRALLEFMYGTGARVTEVVRLQFADLNLRMNFVTLRDVNDESRIVPLGRYAAAALKEYIVSVYDHLSGDSHSDENFVFVNMRGEPLTRQGIWKILKDYGRQIGAEDRMGPQILRDSFAVHILQNGGDLKTLQELMGFDDMSVGIAYLDVLDIHVREVFTQCHPRA